MQCILLRYHEFCMICPVSWCGSGVFTGRSIEICYDSSCVNSKFIQIFLHVSEKKDDNQQICGKNRVKDTKYANAMDNGAVCHIWRKK